MPNPENEIPFEGFGSQKIILMPKGGQFNELNAKL